MAKQPFIPQIQQTFDPTVGQQIFSLMSHRDNFNQYHVSPVSMHTHNNVDSPPVAYTSLAGVQAFLTLNIITLTPAQVSALNTTPIVIVQNPGPRSFVFIDGIAGRLTYGGTAYTGTNNLEFRYTNGSGIKVCADMPSTPFLNATSSFYSYSPPIVDSSRNVDSNFTPIGGDTGNNGQVVVSVPNANPATGNSSVTFIVYYRIISFIT